MTHVFDNLINDLQEQCDNAAHDRFGPGVVARWRNPGHAGVMESPSAVGKLTGSCGDTIALYLRIENDRIIAASFYTDGCAPSVVSGDAAAELAMGKTLDEAAAIEGDTILKLLGGLPEDNAHCAHLAAKTLHAALEDWIKKTT